MDINSTSDITIGSYVKEWWQQLPAEKKRRYWIAAAVFSTVWLAGAIHAPSAVAGLARVEGPFRLLMAVGMGGFSFLWRLLEATGAIQETADKPNLFWLPLALLLPGIIGLFFYLMSQPPNPLFGIQKMLEKASQSQGRAEADDLKDALAIEMGIPLTQIEEGKVRNNARKKGEPNKKTLLGLDYDRAEGHVIVVAPTRAGKGLHLTDTLRHYPGPALIIDPKGEQFERTAGLRSQLGPVYRLPGHQVHLSGYYKHLRDRDETMELHYHLLRPWASSEPIFAEKALSLFTAVGLYASEKKLNPIRLLLDLAESDPVTALTALRTVEAARRHVDIFTNGAAVGKYQEDKFVTSALGNFTTRLAPYQKHIDTIAPPDLSQRSDIVPPDWARRNGTIYITYGLNDLRAVGGVVAATIAAILRHHMHLYPSVRGGQKQKMLVAIDELPAVGLRNIADYLSTCGGYGITLLLYVQSIAQLQGMYGRDGTRAILANCDHQLWYPAAEMETAKFMSELYGTTLKASPMQSASRSSRQHQDREGNAQMQMSRNTGASWSWREGAVLSPNEMMALPKGQVLATTRSAGSGEPMTDRRYLFLGERLNSIPEFGGLPSAAGLHLPKAVYLPRQYTTWGTETAAKAETAVVKAEPAVAKEKPKSAATGSLPVVAPVSEQGVKTAVNPTPEKNEETAVGTTVVVPTAVNPDGDKRASQAGGMR